MNKVLILLINLLIVKCTLAQADLPCLPCLPNGIIFTTQAQIDNFQINYPNCTQIVGNVAISGSDITNLNGLNVINYLWGDLEIVYCPTLINLIGLDNVTSVKDLYITFNDALTSLTGLNNVTSIGGYIYISNCNSLTSLTGLDNITSIDSYMTINFCNALTSLDGLENLASIDGWLSIQSDTTLSSLTALENLIYIGSHLYIIGNPALTSLTGLENVVNIGGYFYIADNDSLNTLTGLNNLTSVGGYLYIADNDILTTLTGLENLSSAGEWVKISNNYALLSLMALENLTSIGGDLFIGGNSVLTGLSGLDNIDAGSITNLYIQDNDSLSACEIKSICEYLVSPNGTIEIHDNATGCNSQQEVTLTCGVGMEENKLFDNHLNIYPNPATTQLIIETPFKGTLYMLNFNGQELLSQKIIGQTSTIEVRSLPNGIYIVKLVSEKGLQVGKVIKQFD